MELIINTLLIKVYKTDEGYKPVLYCEDGSMIEHASLPVSQEGLCAALMLAADVNAGKFWLKSYMGKATDKPIKNITHLTK